MAGLKSNPVVKRLVERGEAGAGKLAQQILASEKFVQGIQKVVQTTLSAKGAFDRNIRVALAAMNLPSTQDLEQLRNKVSELEATLSKIDEKVSQLLEQE